MDRLPALLDPRHERREDDRFLALAQGAGLHRLAQAGVAIPERPVGEEGQRLQGAGAVGQGGAVAANQIALVKLNPALVRLLDDDGLGVGHPAHRQDFTR